MNGRGGRAARVGTLAAGRGGPVTHGTRQVDPKLLPALDNGGDFTLVALVLSYAT